MTTTPAKDESATDPMGPVASDMMLQPPRDDEPGTARAPPRDEEVSGERPGPEPAPPTSPPRPRPLPKPQAQPPAGKGSPSSPSPSPSSRPPTSHDEGEVEDEDEPAAEEDDEAKGTTPRPTLPNGETPAPQEQPEDDGWDFQWDAASQAYFFFNRFTGQTTWENPRLSANAGHQAPGTSATATAAAAAVPPPPPTLAGGYNPAIHGDYDPEAWYAKGTAAPDEGDDGGADEAPDPSLLYVPGGHFSNATGQFRPPPADHRLGPFAGLVDDAARSRRPVNSFFDADAAANSHDGRSLKAERAGKRLSKGELKAFKEKRKAKKEEKRRAWLRD